MATLVFHPAMTRRIAAPEVGGRMVARGNSVEQAKRNNFAETPRAIVDSSQISVRTSTAAPPASGTPPNLRPAVASSDPGNITAAAEQADLAILAKNCLRGDARSWELLVGSQQRRVYGLCYRFTGSTSEAEDLTQDVFLKIYRNLHSFDPSKASLGVWLTTLTRNLLVDNYRRSRVERASDSLDEPMAGEEDGPTRAERLPDTRSGQEHYVAGVELRAKVQEALARVSPELREAVILRDLEDMDYREIADVLAIPQGTVKSRISRGRAELARLLKGMEGQVM